jgi:hypothetical protein
MAFAADGGAGHAAHQIRLTGGKTRYGWGHLLDHREMLMAGAVAYESPVASPAGC